LIVLAVLAVIAVAWSPTFALILVVPALVAFLAYVGMSRRADEKASPPTGGRRTKGDREPKGPWGEPKR